MANWTRLDLQNRVFASLGQANTADNELLTVADVQAALTLGEDAFARDAQCLRRTATMTTVNGTAQYTLPEDLFNVERIIYNTDTLPLTKWSERMALQYATDFASYTSAGSVAYFWQETADTIRMHEPPDTATMTVNGYYVPFAIGGSISLIARSTNVITVTTAAPHKLRVGDAVTTSGCTTSGLNAALTVKAVTSATVFTADDTGSNETSLDGYVYYTGGCLPMLADTDLPPFALPYRIAVADYAIVWLAENVLIDDEKARIAAQTAQLRYARAVSRMCEEGVL